MPRSLVRFFVASLWLLLWSQPAPAAGHRVQLLPSGPGVATLRALVEAELRAAGLEVVEADPVDAVVRLTEQPRGVTIWTARDLRLRTYAADPRSPDGVDDGLARQVAELLRAELVLRPPEPTPRAKPEPPPPAAAPATTQPPPAAVDTEPPTVIPTPVELAPLHGTRPPLPPAWGEMIVAPTVGLSPGPLPPMGLLTLELRVRPFGDFSASLWSALPLGTATATEARGDLVATTGHLGAKFGWDVLSGSPWSVLPQVGASWQWLQLVGRATPPFQSGRATGHLAWVFGGASLSYAATPWLSVVAGGRIGLALPRVTLTIAGDAVGGFGWPAAQAYAGLGLPLRGTPW